MTEQENNIQDVIAFIRETNELIEEIKQLALDENSDPKRLEKQMDKLTLSIEKLRQHPADVWQEARNDIMGLAGNLDAMQKSLTKEYEKAKHDLTSLSQRARAEKSYAAYSGQSDQNTGASTEAPTEESKGD